MRLIAVLCLGLGLGACGDPLAGVERLSDVDVVKTDPVAAALPDAKEVAREGFFGTDAAKGETPEGQEAADAPVKKGLFSGFLGRITRAEPTATPQGDEKRAALPVQKPRTKSRAPSGPDVREVSFGTVLPFGEIARVCDARGKALGQKIDQLGKRGIALYDSAPGIMSKRTYYLTGFDDKCPRQFTAANAMFGPPSFYEQLRFGPAGSNLPYAATDKAYDAIKTKVCRTRKSKPCGSKISRLDADTAFLSAYEFNEHNGQWKELLIHDGKVVAGAVKKMN